MATLDRETSTLTDRYQTTVPGAVRRQLDLRKGDRIRYCIEADGRVYIEPVREEGDDPALGPFLDLLEADIRAHPERIVPLDGDLRNRAATLVESMDVDLDAPLSPDDE